MNNPALFAVEAYKHLENGEIQQALSMCDEGLAKYIDYPTAYLVAVKIALETEGIDKANEYIDRAIQYISLDYVEEYLKKEVDKYTEKQFTFDEDNTKAGAFRNPTGDGIAVIMSELYKGDALPLDNERSDEIAIDDFTESAKIMGEVTQDSEIRYTDENISIDFPVLENFSNPEESTENANAEEIAQEVPAEEELIHEELSDINWSALTAEITIDDIPAETIEQHNEYSVANEESTIKIEEEINEEVEVPAVISTDETIDMTQRMGSTEDISVTEENIPTDIDINDNSIDINTENKDISNDSIGINDTNLNNITIQNINLNVEDNDISLDNNDAIIDAPEVVVSDSIASMIAGEAIDSTLIEETQGNIYLNEFSATEEVSTEEEVDEFEYSKTSKLGEYQKFASAMQDAFESTIYHQPEAVIPEIEFSAKFDGENPENNDISDEELVVQEVETNYSDEEYNYYTDYSEKYQGMRGFALKLMGKKAGGRKFKANKLTSLPGLNNTPSNIGSGTCDIDKAYRSIAEVPAFNIDDIPAMETNNFSISIDHSNLNFGEENTVDYSESDDESVAIVSDTMVNILAMQGAYSEAIEMLEKLKSINPDKLEEYQEKIDNYKSKI